MVAEAVAKATDDDVRILLIDGLGQRGAGERMPVMLDIVNGDVSDEAKTAAYAALPEVARPADFANLLDLLVKTDERYVAHIQDAVVVAVDRGTDREGQTQQVISSFEKASVDAKPLFFSVLAGIGGQHALAIVSDYAGGDNP